MPRAQLDAAQASHLRERPEEAHTQVLQNEILFYVEDAPSICFRFLMLPFIRVGDEYPESKGALQPTPFKCYNICYTFRCKDLRVTIYTTLSDTKT